MIKSVAASSLLASIFLVIQTTWLRNGILGGIIPDLAILVIVWVGYSNRGHEGVVAAFITGLVCDVLSSSPLGYFAFIYIAAAYPLSFLKRALSMDAFIIPVLSGFSATILKGLASIFLSVLFKETVSSPYRLTALRFWVEAVLSGAFAPLLYFLLSKFSRPFITRRVTE